MVTDARALFGSIADRYDRPAELLSVGGYGRWRHALVDQIPAAARTLDVAAGTGLIARDLIERRGCSVIAVDLTEAMLRRAPVDQRVVGDGSRLPFGDGAFEALTFSYLLRYVADPEATLRELVRVVAPGGTIGSVEFGVPQRAPIRAGWRTYARGVFPTLARAFGPAWGEVGTFLPGSIEDWARSWPVARQVEAWRAAGIDHVRVRSMMLGTGIVMTGRKR